MDLCSLWAGLANALKFEFRIFGFFTCFSVPDCQGSTKIKAQVCMAAKIMLYVLPCSWAWVAPKNGLGIIFCSGCLNRFEFPNENCACWPGSCCWRPPFTWGWNEKLETAAVGACMPKRPLDCFTAKPPSTTKR